MLTILLYLFHSRRSAGGSPRRRGTRAYRLCGLRRESAEGPALRTFPLTTAPRPQVFSALSSFKKSCFRISNNLLERALVTGILFVVRELG